MELENTCLLEDVFHYRFAQSRSRIEPFRTPVVKGLLPLCGFIGIWNDANIDQGWRVWRRSSEDYLGRKTCAHLVVNWKGDIRDGLQDRALARTLLAHDN